MSDIIKRHSLNVALFTFVFLFYMGRCQAQVPPNIVFIIADDIGYNDFGCYGNNVKTPNIDRIASQGMIFANFFLTASSCSPSRASIISGRYPHNTGAAELHMPLPANIVTFPEILKNAGYFTAASGKWHLGEAAKKGFYKVDDNNKNIGVGGASSWQNTIRECPADKPFFLWLAAKDAHRPWESNDFAGYNDVKSITIPPYYEDSPVTKEDMANYYDEITRFDHYVGIVEKELKNKGVLDNTIIVITSDNGAPFPRAKTRLYDSGLQSPLIIFGNRYVKQGAICNMLVSAIDIAPTLLAFAGIRPEDNFQGKIFLKLFQNPAKQFRNYVFGEHNWHDYKAFERSVRTKDFLYIINRLPHLSNAGAADVVESNAYQELRNLNAAGKLRPSQQDPFVAHRLPEELFDCKTDPFQLKNLALEPGRKKQLKKMRAVMKKWEKQTEDEFYENITEDWFDRESGRAVNGPDKRGKTPGSAKAVITNRKGPF